MMTALTSRPARFASALLLSSSLLISSGLVTSTAHANSQEQLFEYGKKTYTADQLGIKTQQKLFDIDSQYHQQRTFLLEDGIVELYAAEQAKASGKPVEDVMKSLLKVKEPTEKELKAFYEENKSRIPYPYDQIKAQIVRFVSQQKQQDAKKDLLAKIKKEKGLKMLAVAPIAPKVDIAIDGLAQRGKKQAAVTVVEFADYNCPHCKEASVVFEKIYPKYKNKVNFVYGDYSIMGNSAKIAEAAYCAGKQGKYWQFHKQAFENQGKMDDKKITELAKTLGLKDKDFKACQADKATADFVAKSKKEGARIGVTSTPTIFINGRKVNVAMTVEALSKELDNALKVQGASE